MKEVILIAKTNTRISRRIDYVYRVPMDHGYKWSGRYVTITKFAKSAKRFKSIEEANGVIASFKQSNIFNSWEVVVLSIDTARIQATV
jgi:hypothetical protein